MSYYFKKNGFYTKSPCDCEFKAVDISTVKRGPMYTFVSNDQYVISKHIEVELWGYHMLEDQPKEGGEAFISKIDDNQASVKYSIYPLFNQLNHVNSFLQIMSDDDHIIYLDRCEIRDKKNREIINEFTKDKSVRSIFEKFGMITCVKDIYEKYQGRYLIFGNKRWEFINNICETSINNWKGIFILFPEIESTYLCSRDMFESLLEISEMMIEVTFSEIILRRPKNSIIDFINVDPSYTYTYQAFNFYQILNLCLYVPQLISIEQSIYDLDATIKLTINRGQQQITLIISEKEARQESNTCIFDILKRLLEITRRVV